MDEMQLRQRLQEERERLRQELAQVRSATQKDGAGGEIGGKSSKSDEAAVATELEKNLALEKSLLQRLVEIDHALEKFIRGNYGLCDACGHPIEEARLEFLPQANLCIGCKSRQEKDGRGRWLRK
ncbi:MAG: TraR/DksA C4-type zinc finger protein [Chloroflexi bacterium]|nr:TraR/DksA C4-type zinc finger protein [Chloroflexota bacterium]